MEVQALGVVRHGFLHLSRRLEFELNYYPSADELAIEQPSGKLFLDERAESHLLPSYTADKL